MSASDVPEHAQPFANGANAKHSRGRSQIPSGPAGSEKAAYRAAADHGTSAPTIAAEEAQRLRITGVKINYWATCLRRLWLFAHHITLEHTSDRVALGKFLHETAYRHQGRRDVLVHELIRIDIVEQRNRVVEVKYSPKLLQAARLQLGYYLWYLRELGAQDLTGEIRFPRQRRVERVRLTEELEKQVLRALEEIPRVEASPRPPDVDWKPYCKACAYCELCWG